MRQALLVPAAVLLPGCFAFGQGDGRQEVLASLVAAERAFARTSVEKGLREAFLGFFAEDGIGFQPLPVKAKAALLKQPAPTGPPSTVVSWEPEYADVSQAGDLGYTTGPAVLTDQSPARKPPRHGTYFSIWKRQPDGTWKVALDAGSDGPEGSPMRKAVLAFARPPAWRASAGPSDRAASRASLISADRALLATARARGLAQATLASLAEAARYHRWGFLPFIGDDAIRALVSEEKRKATWEPIDADVARSDDLGFTYGSYELEGSSAADGERGYYARVWKRDRSGAWKVVLDTQSPVPQGRSEDAFVAAGYALLQEGRAKDAIDVFQRMTAAHPRSANAYDCLSDAYLAGGDRGLALQFARQALDRLADDPNPDVAFRERVRESATSKLKQLPAE